jgi:hypothetical protein
MNKNTVSLDKIILRKAFLVDLKDLFAFGLHFSQKEFVIADEIFGFSLRVFEFWVEHCDLGKEKITSFFCLMLF